MSSVEDPVVEPVMAEVAKPPAKEKKPKVPKEKRPKAPKLQTPAHPTYFQMIEEAIMALKEKGGSSPYAIAKYMDKYKSVLPANYKKMLTVQLRNCLAKGKLVKVKGSFKLSEEGKKAKRATAAKKPKSSAAGEKAKKATEGAEEKKKKRVKRKNPMMVPAKSKPSSKVSGKKVGGVKKSKKATPAKPKQPKTIKSPAKRPKKVAA